MRTVGFLISHKNNEGRRAVIPPDLKNINHKEKCFFEKGYGKTVGYSDQDYLDCGVNVVDREKVLECDVITDVKLGDADYIKQLSASKILFGWAHAVQGISFTDAALNGDHTVIAWEEIFEDGRYILYRNREIAGEAAILQGFRFSKKMPYDCKVAIIGNGQTAKGALRILNGLGAEVDIFGRKFEQLFKKKMFDYDVIVNCVMWDTNRTDRLIYKEDIAKMKRGTLIIDVSCDPQLEIETSRPTTIDNPVYEVDGVVHYAVDNTPAMYPVTVTKYLSQAISKLVDYIIIDDLPDYLKKAIVIEQGKIIDENIKKFRTTRGYFCK